MKKLIKTLHVACACLWLGAAASVVVLQCLRGWSGSHRELAALNLSLTLLDFALIIPGAVGSLLTGFFICKTTSWHFVRYRWVIVKWIGAVSAILAGAVLLGPWQIKMLNLSGELTSTPVAGGPYDVIRLLFTVTGFLQVYLLIAMIAVSVVKPWGRRLPRQEVTKVPSASGGSSRLQPSQATSRSK